MSLESSNTKNIKHIKHSGTQLVQESADLLANKFGFESMEDKEVWSSFKNGHEGAFSFIYGEYFPILFRYGYGFTKDRESIKDIIQDLFIELRQSGNNLSDTTSIKYYLFRSFRHKMIRFLKKNRTVLLSPTIGQWGLEFEVSYETKLNYYQLEAGRFECRLKTT